MTAPPQPAPSSILVGGVRAGTRLAATLDALALRHGRTIVCRAPDPTRLDRWLLRQTDLYPPPRRSPPGHECANSPCRWDFSAGTGAPPFAARALARSWHRPPYALTLRLTKASGPEAGQVLAEARIGTRLGWRALIAKLCATAALLLRQALERGTPLRPSAPTPFSPAPFSPAPAAPSRLPLPLTLARGWIGVQAARWAARLRTEWWSIGVCPHSAGHIAATGDLGAIGWMEPRRGGSYLADPFAWPGTPDVLCEEMPPGGSGRIVVLRGAAGLSRGPTLLATSGHLSYPCTFAHRGRAYVVPEAIAAPATSIFELLPNGTLYPVAQVAPGEPLADPTLFAHGGLCWLAGTSLAIGPHDNLCLFHAPAPGGPWQAHRANPVRLDVRGARPAGTPFVWDGRLIRPGQDCAASYGAAIVLHEVLELTPHTFAERALRRLDPDPRGPFPHGLHTLSVWGERVLIDGKRMVFRRDIVARLKSRSDIVARLKARAGIGRRLLHRRSWR